MSILFICCALLTTGYVLLMLIYAYGWQKQKVFTAPEGFQPATSVAIIVPARNETANIEACIQSLLGQDFPVDLVEIVVVDDHSEDTTAILAAAMGELVRVVDLKDELRGENLPRSYKKCAIYAGIRGSRGTLIITTDADCIAPRGWLKQIVALYESTQAAMIIAPVSYSNSGSLVELFQSLDFTTMQGITAAAQQLGSGSMANGANLAFSRVAFHAVNGYEGINHLASGDDYLLLHKMQQKFPAGIHYLKSSEAIISTMPQPDWRSFLQQRIRWASKSGKYPDHKLTAILMLVYAFNVALAGTVIAICFFPEWWPLPVTMLGLKVAAELIFLFPVAVFFRKKDELVFFPLLQPLHIAYIILAGFLGLFGSYRWKGRTLR